MPVQRGKSELFAKLGKRLGKGVAEHKNDDTTYGQVELPAGIENGVAQLVDCKFTKIKADAKSGAGEYMFYAAGIVKQPRDHGGVPVEGMRTSITEPLYDTPTRTRKTVEAHLGWIMNEMAKLGIDRSAFAEDGSNIEELAAALAQAKPHFRFRTWKGDKQELEHKNGKVYVGDRAYPNEAAAKAANPFVGKEPRVNHQWNGAVDYDDQYDPTAAVVDHTTASANGTYASPDEFPDGEAAPDAEDPPPADTAEPGDDLDALVEAAGGDDDEALQAQARLKEIALEAGVGEEDVDGADSWEAVKELIESQGSEGDGEDAAAETEEWKPEKGEIYRYHATDPKTKKPRVNPKTKKPVLTEVEVMAVDAAKRTVNLKSLEDGRVTWKAVSWDALESAS